MLVRSRPYTSSLNELRVIMRDTERIVSKIVSKYRSAQGVAQHCSSNATGDPADTALVTK